MNIEGGGYEYGSPFDKTDCPKSQWLSENYYPLGLAILLPKASDLVRIHLDLVRGLVQVRL